MSDTNSAPILIGYDGYDDAAAAIRLAGPLLPGRRAIVACVWNSFAATLLHSNVEGLTGAMKEAAEEFDAGERERASELAEDGARLAREAGFEARPAAVLGKPKAWPSLLDLADEHGAAAIVVGSEGLGTVKSALIGSVSAGLLHHSRRPILVVPRRTAEDANGPLVVGYDGSEHAGRAIETAGSLFAGREAIVETVWIPYTEVAAASGIAMPAAVSAEGAQKVDEELAARAERSAEDGAGVAKAAGLEPRAEAIREHGNVSHTLIESARANDAAAIVVGSRGRSGIATALLGSVSTSLVHHTPVPLLVVPPPA
ncbi:MAG TPA: universal stress protein [Thermoleophilaceae bacterium]|nr:universal stress protein [Thermoleophilaceae bacterium]